MVCSIPIIGKGGEVWGVCGFEISNLNFYTLNSPDMNLYPHITALIAPLDNAGLGIEGALVSGNIPLKNGTLKIQGKSRGLSLYEGENEAFAGLHGELRLYGANSPFAGERFAAAVLVPRQELAEIIIKSNLTIALVLILLFGMSAALAAYLSRRYVKPITRSLKALEQGKPEETSLHEIDLLLEKIAALKASRAPLLRSSAEKAERPLPEALFGDFISRCKTLTPTERQIFNYYVQGFSTEEIFAAKAMSPHTFKAHNAHIYAKLGVSSREELFLYIELIKKSGLLPENL